MFNKDKIIEFVCNEAYPGFEDDKPIPSKLNIPDWYKKLEHHYLDPTIKGCMPFLDSLTIGYILKMPQDFALRHNILNEEGKPDAFQTFGTHQWDTQLKSAGINLNASVECHPTKQLKGCPYVKDNSNLPFHKLMNPWVIKTPPGYSCLFVPPLNNCDDRFFIMPGVVDTDVFPSEINFPIVVNGAKYPNLDTLIKKGTPYVQVIPFKRESWTMKTSKRNSQETLMGRLKQSLLLFRSYQNQFWKKKLWK